MILKICRFTGKGENVKRTLKVAVRKMSMRFNDKEGIDAEYLDPLAFEPAIEDHSCSVVRREIPKQTKKKT